MLLRPLALSLFVVLGTGLAGCSDDDYDFQRPGQDAAAPGQDMAAAKDMTATVDTGGSTADLTSPTDLTPLVDMATPPDFTK